jgi:predicted RNA-binding Zn ribbon-like protein
MSAVPSWFPASETKPAPMPLLVVQAFVNTLDLEEGTDVLTDPDTAHDWLVEARLLDPAARRSASDLNLAREVRESLRMLLRRDGDTVGGIGEGLAPLRKLADTRRARLTVGEAGAIALENARNQDLGDALFQLLLIVHSAQEDGSWERLKVCANDECQWAFFDRSRNQQGSWCDMAVCGNRLKNRQLRARRR